MLPKAMVVYEQAYQDSQAKQAKSTITPNDPLFDQQWWIGAIGADEAWVQSTGSTDQVIAILDTGVDWTHPDLQNKIWQNPGETANGSDSDGNGFVDDIRGWDFINHRNNPMDDNSHGTHVAGIAAAEADNGIGIAGVSWGARIMPVKVLQSSGAGTAATIVQGINYAANNGATVINMSFGGYALSLAMQDALANAYATAVLVAAAGNDGICIGPGMFCAPMFPAAFSFVMGVEASSPLGGRASFSNYDQDGPVYSGYPELYNYELTAPGAGLVSTIPGGNYRVYSGTSMAAPIIAGSAAIYRSVYPDKSQEIMWADMIHSSDGVFNLPKSIIGITESMLSIVSHFLVDTLNGDGDGQPDAGETIEIWYTLRNTGAQANDVNIGLRLGEFEDTTAVDIINNHAYLGSISSFASRTHEENPFIIRIDSNLVHDRHVVLEAFTYDEGGNDTIYQPLTLVITNRSKLSGILDSTYVLTPDKKWLVSQSFRIGSDGHLILKPGVELKLDLPVRVYGELTANGKSDSLIQIEGPGWFFRGGLDEVVAPFRFCSIKNINTNTIGNFRTLATDTIVNSYFKNITTGTLFPLRKNLYIKNNVFINMWGTYFQSSIYYAPPQVFKNNNFINVRSSSATAQIMATGQFRYNNFLPDSKVSSGTLRKEENYGNNFFGYTLDNTPITALSGDIIKIKHQYWGSSDSLYIQNNIIYDFWDDPTLALVQFWPFLNKPSSEANGIVWKVLVNGADAQDEYVEPVGVGPQRFDVYFNRPMDIAYTPMVTFGVRAPYTQQAVNENGIWSADSTIYTVYKTMQLYTGDGINRVRVAGARDPEGFEIPIEDMRFEFLIDAAGAASAGFMATPGMGKIDLEWDDPGELDDLLGFNLYRFEHVTDTTFTQPKLLNPALALEPLFTDFDVKPGDKYYYYYKILRTNLVESDSSRVVSAVPYTAAPGDANGDLGVNVMDIMAIVAYMLGNNPQPFIFEAADVNQDGLINVLDIVGVIQLINAAKGEVPGKNYHTYEPAFIALNDDVIVLDSKGQVAALQFELQTDWPDLIRLTSLLPGFELAWTKTADGVRGILFNMQGKTIEAGLTSIVKVEHQNPDLTWGNLIGSDPVGKAVDILTTPVGVDQHITLPMEFSLELFPNPAKDHITVSYFLPVMADVQVKFYDIFGKELTTAVSTRQTAGNYELSLNTQHLGVGSGMVFCRMTAVGADGSRYQRIQKLLIAR